MANLDPVSVDPVTSDKPAAADSSASPASAPAEAPQDGTSAPAEAPQDGTSAPAEETLTVITSDGDAPGAPAAPNAADPVTPPALAPEAARPTGIVHPLHVDEAALADGSARVQ
jgi:hypothetical protein